MIEVFADVCCPFTHVGLRRLVARRGQLGGTDVVHAKAWHRELSVAHDVALDPHDDAAVITDWQEGQRRGVVGSPYFFANDQGFFCPSLEITHVGDRLRVRRDDETLERFLEVALN